MNRTRIIKEIDRKEIHSLLMKVVKKIREEQKRGKIPC